MKSQPSAYSKRFSSKLSTYFEKSEFSLFVIGQKTKSRTSDFFEAFLVYVSTFFEKSEFSLFVIG